MAQAQVAVTGAQQHSAIAQVTHWAMFVLITAQYVIAWVMPQIEWATEPETLINLHLSLGALLLPVVFCLAWRCTHLAPPPVAGTPVWQRCASWATHVAIYVLLVVLPIAGRAAASVRG